MSWCTSGATNLAGALQLQAPAVMGQPVADSADPAGNVPVRVAECRSRLVVLGGAAPAESRLGPAEVLLEWPAPG